MSRIRGRYLLTRQTIEGVRTCRDGICPPLGNRRVALRIDVGTSIDQGLRHCFVPLTYRMKQGGPLVILSIGINIKLKQELNGSADGFVVGFRIVSRCRADQGIPPTFVISGCFSRCIRRLSPSA